MDEASDFSSRLKFPFILEKNLWNLESSYLLMNIDNSISEVSRNTATENTWP